MWNNYIFLLIAVISIFILYMFLMRQTTFIKKKPSLKLPGYRLFYSDQKNSAREEGVIYSQLLVSTYYQISGKPDFVFISKNLRILIPVELKSGKVGESRVPHTGDLMQLVAYFLILEDVYDIQPKYGRLVYSDHMFIIKNTKRLRLELLEVLSDMRSMLNSGERHVEASYPKCKYCTCRDTVCEFCE